MYKKVISDIKIYNIIRRIPGLKKFFVFNVRMLHSVKDTVIFDDIISTISNNNGTAKTSYGNRFSDLDDLTAEFLKEGKQVVHDTAVSSGITSLELYNKLKINSNIEFYISDKYSIIYHTNYTDTVVFFDADAKAVFGYKDGNLLSEQLNSFFKNSVTAFQKIKHLKLSDSPEKIWLLNPKVVNEMDKTNISFLEYDLFDAKEIKRFTFVRSMNILNTIYFEESQIIKAISNIHNSLQDGGYFLIGRTGLDRVNRATFYRKSGNLFDEVLKVNEGSEVEYLIKSFNTMNLN